MEDRSEVRARINELETFLGENGALVSPALQQRVHERIAQLEAQSTAAQEPVAVSIIRSHKAICEVKKMDEKAAYGQDPAVYYTLGVCGEAGEMANAIVKTFRRGFNKKKILEAVKSELPDVIIYSYVLAHVLDIDLTELVNEKVEVVIKRALDGYYGGEFEGDESPESIAKTA